jgi:hypothetical protein
MVWQNVVMVTDIAMVTDMATVTDIAMVMDIAMVTSIMNKVDITVGVQDIHKGEGRDF